MSALAGWMLRVLAIALPIVGVFASQERAKSIPFAWKGQSATTAKPPAGLDPRALAAIARFGPWARENEYDVHVELGGRIVLIVPQAHAADAVLEKLARTVELFDRLLPPPSAAAVAPPASSGGTAPTPPGEDPEGAPPVVIPPKSSPTPDASSTKEVPKEAAFERDRETPTLFVIKDAGDYFDLLDALVDQESYLASWAVAAKGQAGFTLERPLVGAVRLNVEGQEEWSLDHELIHRAQRLLTLARFSQQPYWLTVGLAWHAELSIEGSVYCFPYRESFVGVGEHTDWDRDLESRFEERAKRPLEAREFAGWKRGTYDDHAARIAWGVVDYFATVKPRELQLVLEELRVLREARNRVDRDGGRWERDPDFELALEDQHKVLAKHLGADYLARLTARFRRAQR